MHLVIEFLFEQQLPISDNNHHHHHQAAYNTEYHFNQSATTSPASTASSSNSMYNNNNNTHQFYNTTTTTTPGTTTTTTTTTPLKVGDVAKAPAASSMDPSGIHGNPQYPNEWYMGSYQSHGGILTPPSAGNSPLITLPGQYLSAAAAAAAAAAHHRIQALAQCNQACSSLLCFYSVCVPFKKKSFQFCFYFYFVSGSCVVIGRGVVVFLFDFSVNS